MLKKLIGFLKPAYMSKTDKYLSESVSHADLDRRIREIEQGTAPFQTKHTNHLWVI